MKGHSITGVIPGSIADEMEIASGDLLLSVNGQELRDVFDYHYLINDEYIVLLIQKPDGEEWELEIEKEENEDIGIIFEQALLDDYKSCHNKCIFCFIDQNPPGMRETIYFKDDDSRLSFLQGNYVTLTNMDDAQIERIIHFHLAPINVSVHTTNPELRCKMLHNRFAGEALDKMKKLADAEIEMNSQIVLCKGWNDGDELDSTIKDLAALYPAMQSLSVVPMGMTKYRDGLEQVEKFNKADAIKVLEQISFWQDKLYKKNGSRFVHASDEWYILAEKDIPPAEYYEGYGQLENGIGMVRLFLDEFDEALSEIKDKKITCKHDTVLSVISGTLFAPFLKECIQKLEKELDIKINVYPVVNDFYGEDITVTGLLTGQDIISQLKDKEKGSRLFLPDVMLRSGEEVLLDDVTVTDIAKALQTDVCIVKSSGNSLLEAVIKTVEINE